MDYMLEPPAINLDDPTLWMNDEEIEKLKKSIAEDMLEWET